MFVYILYCVQRVGFLPPKDSEEEVVWVTLEDSEILEDIDWKVLTFTPPPEQENSQYRKNTGILSDELPYIKIIWL